MRTIFAVFVTALLAACGGGSPAATAPTEHPEPLLLVDADLITAAPGTLAGGPVISGSLQPELKADLRAEVAGIVLEVLRDNGDPVKRGDLLLRIDATAIRDNLLSAKEAESAAVAALDQAERQYTRMQTLAQRKLVAVEATETAEGVRNQAESALASARARVVESRQLLEKTEVRAPFDGVVGARLVSAGNTVQVGMELLKVLDVGTMRLEGMIAAEEIGKVKPGARVSFRVNGYPGEEFQGAVERINPVVNPATRQVQVLVSLPPTDVAFVAGLYAEGRVELASVSAILLPESALVRDGDATHVWLVRDGVLQHTAVVLGEHDRRLGRYVIDAGVSAGDQVLRHPLGALSDGRAVEIGAAQPAGERNAVD